MTSGVTIRSVTSADVPALSALHARVFGPGRFARSAYRVREGRPDLGFSPYCRLAEREGAIVAAVRMTDVSIGGTAGAALLGPLVVGPNVAGQGIGAALMTEAVDAARAGGRSAVLLVGDESYYGRVGFKRVPFGQISLPGPVDLQRLLAVELIPGAVSGLHGIVAAD